MRTGTFTLMTSQIHAVLSRDIKTDDVAHTSGTRDVTRRGTSN